MLRILLGQNIYCCDVLEKNLKGMQPADMVLYGESLFKAGIFIIFAVLILAAALGTVYLINSFRLKKQPESGYGKKDK